MKATSLKTSVQRRSALNSRQSNNTGRPSIWATLPRCRSPWASRTRPAARRRANTSRSVVEGLRLPLAQTLQGVAIVTLATQATQHPQVVAHRRAHMLGLAMRAVRAGHRRHAMQIAQRIHQRIDLRGTQCAVPSQAVPQAVLRKARMCSTQSMAGP